MRLKCAICAVLVSCVCSGILLARSATGTPTGEWKEWHNVRVLSGEYEGDPWNQMQLEDGRVVWMKFCNGSPFVKGMVIETLKYENRRECLSLESPGGYIIRRNQDGKPLYVAIR